MVVGKSEDIVVVILFTFRDMTSGFSLQKQNLIRRQKLVEEVF